MAGVVQDSALRRSALVAGIQVGVDLRHLALDCAVRGHRVGVDIVCPLAEKIAAGTPRRGASNGKGRTGHQSQAAVGVRVVEVDPLGRAYVNIGNCLAKAGGERCCQEEAG